MKLLLAAASLSLLACSCRAMRDANPAAPGFDGEGSDARAIELADATMRAMGGRRAWEETRVIAWTFFGRRAHVWDKRTGDYRLEDGERVVLMNLESGEGRVFDRGVELAEPEAVAAALAKARSIWINDSYWLVMPYKLKDSGVTLRYGGEDSLPDGRPADALELTFRDVGDTPQNKYRVWIARDTGLVERWAYFASAADPEPKIVTPWADWRPYGSIRLSGGRGEGRELSAIAVLDAPPASLAAP